MGEMTDNQLKLMQLRNYQAMPLGAKVTRSLHLIREWYEAHDGLVYVAFSGGADSTVLLHLVRSIYPDVPAVFADTGNELNTVRDFVKTFGNSVVWVKPKMSFNEVIKTHGYPVVSKEQSGFIHEVKQILKKGGSKKLLDIRTNGNKWGRGKISEKWKHLISAPFNVTHKCCKHLKINPTSEYRKQTGRATMTGVMTDESALRSQTFIRFGCNAFDMKDPTSRPIIFWKHQDVLQYLKRNELRYAEAYGDIIESDGALRLTGAQRTGCKFCLFGVHLEKGENRIQRLARVEPESYRHCIEDLGYDYVMDHLGVEWRSVEVVEREKQKKELRDEINRRIELAEKDVQKDMFDNKFDIPADEIKEKI